VRRALEAEGIQTVPPVAGQSADAVYVAWYPECGMDQIHAAALAVLDGVPFYTASDVPFFATSAGRTFGYSSAISGAIARVAGVEPALTGKPSAAALAFVARRLGVAAHALAVVGDDPKVETEMARTGGAIGIGVTTGTTTLEQWAEQGPNRQAHHVVSRISDILDIGLF
jgi:ribonucleotide monophosphatase NagD (HAD superfamily)